jgi:hypothetical protein
MPWPKLEQVSTAAHPLDDGFVFRPLKAYMTAQFAHVQVQRTGSPLVFLGGRKWEERQAER